MFFSIFLHFYLNVFRTPIVYYQTVYTVDTLCVRSTSYSCKQIVWTLHECLCRGLNMCMSFRYNPKSIFPTVSAFLLSYFSTFSTIKLLTHRYLVCATPLTVVGRCFCHGLKMCMRFGYHPDFPFDLVVFERFLIH